MVSYFWSVVGAVAPILFLGGSGLAQECHLRQTGSLDLTLTTEGRYTIPVVVNDTPLNFYIDLSGAQSGISEAVAARLDLHRTRPSYVVTARSFQAGPSHGSNIPFLTVDKTLDPTGKVDGMLAISSLSSFDLELDFRKNKLNFFAPDHCAGRVIYWTHDPVGVGALEASSTGGYVVTMKLDGKPLQVAPSTISLNSLMRIGDAIQTMGILPDNPGLIVDKSAPGSFPAYVYPFKALSADGVAISNPNIRILSDPACAAGQTRLDPMDHKFHTCFGSTNQLTLGLNELRSLHLFLAFSEHKLYVTAASAQ